MFPLRSSRNQTGTQPAGLISPGKRHAEVGRLGAGAADHRAVLDWYRPSRTRAMIIITQVVAIVSIAVWTATVDGLDGLVAAIVVILERFRRLVSAGEVADPVRVIPATARSPSQHSSSVSPW